MYGFIVCCLVLLLAGCTTTDSTDNDPLEGYNRAMTRFNLQLDEAILVPLATGYTKAVPEPVRGGFGNFFRNLKEPYTLVNNLLQGRPLEAGQGVGRFLINTILGFAGFADMATELGIEYSDEDFGQTLAVWGVPPGPHLVLPVFGPSSLRDGFGVATGLVYGDPVWPDDSGADVALGVVRVMDTRARFLGTEELLALQPDPYLFLRESYRQRRQAAIRNGEAPDDSVLEEELLDELLQD